MGNRSNIIDPTSDEALYGYTSPNVGSTEEIVVDVGVPNTNTNTNIDTTTILSNPDLVSPYSNVSNTYGTAPTRYVGDVSDIAGGQSIRGVGEVDSQGRIVNPNNPNSPTPENTGAWTKNLQAGASVVGATAGLANAYLGFKNYALAKKQYAFQKSVTNRNLANQATLINEQLDRRARVGNALAGNTLTADEKAARLDRAAKNHVDGSSI